ncbi:hypothetical protein F5879DRAFT_981769 [Lentinula edodes]|nr:hypothetical protein F5879DRAFT_981769 [Lentinula edodes]
MDKKVPKIIAAGHNHISITFALMSGQGERWAEEVVDWMKAAVCPLPLNISIPICSGTISKSLLTTTSLCNCNSQNPRNCRFIESLSRRVTDSIAKR